MKRFISSIVTLLMVILSLSFVGCAAPKRSDLFLSFDNTLTDSVRPTGWSPGDSQGNIWIFYDTKGMPLARCHRHNLIKMNGKIISSKWAATIFFMRDELNKPLFNPEFENLDQAVRWCEHYIYGGHFI